MLIQHWGSLAVHNCLYSIPKETKLSFHYGKNKHIFNVRYEKLAMGYTIQYFHNDTLEFLIRKVTPDVCHGFRKVNHSHLMATYGNNTDHCIISDRAIYS